MKRYKTSSGTFTYTKKVAWIVWSRTESIIRPFKCHLNALIGMKSYLWAIITRFHPDCSFKCACADKKRYRAIFSRMSTRNVSLLKHSWRLARRPQRKTAAHVNLLINIPKQAISKTTTSTEIEKWRHVAHLCSL